MSATDRSSRESGGAGCNRRQTALFSLTPCDNRLDRGIVEYDKRSSTRRRIVRLQTHPDPYVTTTDLADYWGITRKQIYKQIDAGTLTALRLGPHILRIKTAEAVRFERVAKMSPAPDVLMAYAGHDEMESAASADTFWSPAAM
jgi:excisionase family DNA binding protein